MKEMKATGIVRKFDENGRFVIPMELRKKLHLTDVNDALEIFVEGDSIILKKYEPACVFCGGLEDVLLYKDKKICRACAQKIGLLFDV